MPKRKPIAADYNMRRALMLPLEAQYDWIMGRPASVDLGTTINSAMEAIEASFEPLAGVLPRDYGKFERPVLEDLLRVFNGAALKTASGDLFGRIYEYFLMKFAMQGAQDNGEFFTPPSIVQTIVNVIEPDHGTVFDPACGSAGMFVQSSHFIESHGQDTSRRVTFYGQEKTATTIKLAKMNLAVHGLEGDISEANTFYVDAHTLVGRCDFVMANPPFNVDQVDSEKIKGDPRLPFGLPGVTKNKQSKKETVSNGNYLWISYFHSYLNPTGRAGFVMSSQASSAGHGERDVRRKLVETGHVDVMVAIRSNFFYTRSVPCELWFLDKGKPADRRDTVLMLDAREVYRKVSRKINDFSPEQAQNLSAIVWLYRGQPERFLALVASYVESIGEQCRPLGELVGAFEAKLDAAVAAVRAIDELPAEATATLRELGEARAPFAVDRDALLAAIATFVKATKPAPATNAAQHAARKSFDPIAERLKGLLKQVDHLAKLAGRAADAVEGGLRRTLGAKRKELDAGRHAAVEQLKFAAYFHRQVGWLQDHFPEARLAAVPGLVKVVTRADIEAADWSLTPGRYVGVAPAAVDEDFDFEQTIRDLHVELAGLNDEAAELAKTIAKNFQELGV